MNLETMKKYVCEIASDYPIKRVVLFGSISDGSFRLGRDVDLMMEFKAPVNLQKNCYSLVWTLCMDLCEREIY